MIWCSACGAELSDDIDEALHDEKGDYINENFGLPNDPVGDENSHVQVIYRDTGTATRCRREGKMTSLMDHPPEEDGGSSESQQQKQPNGGNGGDESNGKEKPSRGGRQQQQRSRRASPEVDEVYDIDEDKDPRDILLMVIENDVFGLSREQMLEVMDWAEIYDGQIPPDQLEKILSNMSGVQKQSANLMRQKYEAKLNKWMQEQNQGDSGPQLGATYASSTRGMPTRPNNQPPHRPKRQPQRPPNKPQGGGGGGMSDEERKEMLERKKSEKESEDGGDGSKQKPRREKMREHRLERRQEAIDKAADELAQNLASEAGVMLKDFRSIARTLFKKKAENDPDWFFEKMEKWDMDLLDELMSESEAKRMDDGSTNNSPTADSEVDGALESIKSNEGNSGGMGSTTATTQPSPDQQPETQPQSTDGGQEMGGVVDEEMMDDVMMDDEGEPEEEEYEDTAGDDEIDQLLSEME